MSPSLLEIAEAPGAFVVPPHPSVVDGGSWLFLPLSPTLGAVQRIRLSPDELPEAREQVRALAAKAGVPEVGWFRSELTEPAELGALLDLELRETLVVLALERAPDATGGLAVREVETLEDYIAAQKIDAVANGWPIAADEMYAPMWEVARERFLLWLALDGDRPVGMARCAPTERVLVLIGGSVLPEARGRGAYRSLVAARWRSAAERGIGALVTSANAESRPILERLGFERLGEIEVWVERV